MSLSLRRPRIKPAAILKPRRPTLQDQNNPDPEESSSSIAIATTTNDENLSESTNTVTTIIPKSEFIAIADNEIKKESIVDKPKPLAPSRRLIKPSVVLPVRKKVVPSPVAPPTQDFVRIDTNTVIDFKPDVKQLIPISDTLPLIPTSPNNNYEKSTENFKSPFMSPSMHTNNQQCAAGGGSSIIDDIAPPSPKIRQRIRPTPCFNRRNSIQGTTSDCDEDTNRRQRHLSTSSSHSTTIANKNLSQIGRIRTESTCSNVSDIISSNNVRSTIGSIKSKKSTTRSTDGLSKISMARRDFTHRFNGQTPDKNRLTMFDMIYYNPITNPMKNPAPKSTSDIRDRRSSVCSVASSIKSMDSGKSIIRSQLPVSPESIPINSIPMKCEPKEEIAMPVPQLKLGPDGEIILDEQSLVIETTIGKEARETLANADIVYDDEFSGTSGFYKRSKRTRDWPADETIKFYRCLHTIGTDFSLMLTLFPKRTRRDLKLKFKREEKYNLSLVNKALLHPKQFNIDELKIELEREEEEDAERKKAQWQELKAKEAKIKKEVIKERSNKTQNNRISSSLRDLNSYDIYEHEFVTVPKRQRNKKLKRCQVDPESMKNMESVAATDTIAKKRKAPVTKKKENIVDGVNNIIDNDKECFSPPGPKCSKRQTEPKKDKNISTKTENNDDLEQQPSHILPTNEHFTEHVNYDDEFMKPSDVEHILSTDEQFIENEHYDDELNQQNVDYILPSGEQFIENENFDDINNDEHNFIIADIRDASLIPYNDNEYSFNETVIKDFVNDEQSEENDNDILNMEIIFDSTNNANQSDTNRNMKVENSDECAPPVPVPDNLRYDQENESPNENCGDAVNNVEDVDDDDDDEEDTDDESDQDDIDKLNDLQGSLVVVASQDSKDPTKVVHEVFVMSSVTGQLSEEPLDLPQDVIEQIMLSMNPA